MRRTPLALIAALGWLGSQGCMFVHDTDCATNLDCNSGRICDAGQCVTANSEGGPSASPSETGTGTGTGSTTTEGPSCTDVGSGTQSAATVGADFAICSSKVQSLSVTIGSGALVRSIDGRSCTLKDPGYKCYSTQPDVYACGTCTFKLTKETVGTTVAGFAIQPQSCLVAGCADYCCTSSEGTTFPSMYWLGETPSSGGTEPGTGGTGGGSNSGCSGYQSCSVCYQSCDDSCYDYPMGCLGPCFQGCDKCCTP